MKPTHEHIQATKLRITNIFCQPEHKSVALDALTLAEQVALGEVVLEQPWQPIETAPKDGTEVLTLLEGVVCLNHFIDINTNKAHPEMKTWNNVCIHPEYKHPTHWKPLPQPPQEASECLF